jgi:glutamyl-Q tRNA(Asp) synthetase
MVGSAASILHQLSLCGLHSDSEVIYQSRRNSLYEQALNQLIAKGLAYPCACTRKEIEAQQANLGLSLERHKSAVYPGTCRNGLHGKPARAWRFNVLKWSELRGSPEVDWTDRRLGPQSQNVQEEVGDFVLKRADGMWAYQLAVVVDDSVQGITHVVRGEDLTDNTARQYLLQEALGYDHPHYLHTPLVLGDNGEKLSKQNDAKALDLSSPQAVCLAMQSAASALGLSTLTLPVSDSAGLDLALGTWSQEWAQRYLRASP